MKHANLRSLAHNIAQSIASGIGLMIGTYELDVFGEAARSEEGYITVDSLNGLSSGAQPTPVLADAISRYAAALPDLCKRHHMDVNNIVVLSASYSGVLDKAGYVVEVSDRFGGASCDRYVGVPGARPKIVDALGRLRRLKAA